jgi:hypothetical protein
MFVLGETKEPLDETSLLIEDITRRQIMEIVCLWTIYKWIASGDMITKKLIILLNR